MMNNHLYERIIILNCRGCTAKFKDIVHQSKTINGYFHINPYRDHFDPRIQLAEIV